MIYEYPEEFIVPVIYVKEFKAEPTYRDKKPKPLHLGKLVIPDEELQGDELFLAKVDIYGSFQNKDINFLNLGGGTSQEPIINEDMIEGVLEDENIKNILNDIDEDYASNEVLNM